jgi:hypothetical protein
VMGTMDEVDAMDTVERPWRRATTTMIRSRWATTSSYRSVGFSGFHPGSGEAGGG